MTEKKEPAKKKTLSLKQKRFISEYLVDHNGTQAVIRAGYSKNGASVQANTLLANPMIKEIIESKTQAIIDRNDIDFDWGVRMLKETLECDLYDFFEEDHDGFINFKGKSELTLKQRRSISELSVNIIEAESGPKQTIKIKRDDRLKAFDQLAKLLGWYNEDRNTSNVNIIIDSQDARL